MRFTVIFLSFSFIAIPMTRSPDLFSLAIS